VRAFPEYHIVDAASARYAVSIRVPMRFVVESPLLDRQDAEQASGRLSALSRECGCSTGARFLALSTFFCAACICLSFRVVWMHPISSVSLAVLACFLSAGIGKTVGISRARNELRVRLLSICQQLESQKEPI
jgi:hypothetical protein